MFTLTRAQARDLDRRCADEFGLPTLVLMENAGRGCAELLMRLNTDKRPTVILCGPGNNGGDGFVMARHLDNAGWAAEVWAVEAPAAQRPSGVVRTGFDFSGLPPDAILNIDVLSRAGMYIRPISRREMFAGARNYYTGQLLQQHCWIVDALFGTGLSRALAEPFVELVSILNASACPVLALDIPSGLDADSGEPLGPTVRATHTATFVAPKRGFLNPAAKAWTGEVHVIDTGAPRKLVEEYRQGERSP